MMFVVWISIVFSVSIQVSMQQVIPDLYIIQQVYVNEGNDVSIQCNKTELLYKEIYWTKNETYTSFHRDGKFLNFTRINRTDHGEYICTSFDNKTQVLTEIGSIMINVFYKAKVRSIRINPPELTENDTYAVICDVEGNPPPLWRVVNNYTKELLDSGQGSGTFVTRSIKGQCGDTGAIVCEANNTLNNHQAFMTENITVYCSPRPLEENSYTAIGYVGGVTFLILNVRGYPYPNYTWSRDNGEPIGHATQIDYPFFTVLSMSNIAVGDFGNYSVITENSHGYYIANFQLKALGQPEMPYNLNYSDVTSNSVRMYWTSGFDMGAPQYFLIRKLIGGNSYSTISNRIYDNSSTHGVGQNWTFLQTGLESDAEITLTVQSFNGFGYHSHILHGVTFHTMPAASTNGSHHNNTHIPIPAAASTNGSHHNNTHIPIPAAASTNGSHHNNTIIIGVFVAFVSLVQRLLL